MRRLLLSLLLPLFLMLPVTAATSWNQTKIGRSIGQLNFAESNGVCTVVAIAPKNVFLTAAHCVRPNMIVDEWLSVRVKQIDLTEYGLAVLKGESDKAFPPIQLGPKPTAGAATLRCSYPMGSPAILCTAGPMTAASMMSPDGAALFMWSAAGAGGGMSGGPVLDANGKLISILQGGFDSTSDLSSFTLSTPYEQVASVYKESNK